MLNFKNLSDDKEDDEGKEGICVSRTEVNYHGRRGRQYFVYVVW